MNAGVVLAFLVDAQRGVKLLHQRGVAVTLAAVGRNVERPRLSQVAFAHILCGFLRVSLWVAAMAVVAGQPAPAMYVVVKQFSRRTEARIIQLRMTLDTGTLFLRRSCGNEEQNEKDGNGDRAGWSAIGQ